MAQVVELTIGDSPATRYIVERTLEDGRVILRPDDEDRDWRPLTPEEFDALVAPYLKPPDGEG